MASVAAKTVLMWQVDRCLAAGVGGMPRMTKWGREQNNALDTNCNPPTPD